MKFEMDEMLLTAYALGELEPAERARAAALVQANADARRYVEDVRESAALVAEELSRESTDGLTVLQHEVLERQLRELRPRTTTASRMPIGRWVPVAASIAASVVIVCGTLALLLPRFYFRPAVTSSETSESIQQSVAVSGPDGEVLLPPLPKIVHPPREEAFESASDLANLDDEEWQAVEGMVDPREFQDEPVAKRAEPSETPMPDKPQAPPAPKVARGPAQSPDAEDVRPGGGRPGVGPGRNPASRGPRGVYVSPPRDRQAFEEIKKTPAGDANLRVYENPLRLTSQRTRSSFPVRVDAGSLLTVRKHLLERELPPPHRVRIEELINRFAYRYPAPPADGPAVAVSVEIAACPWNVRHRLARVAIKAREGGASVVARNVEVSVEFNPLATSAWRLIGYENAPATPANQPASAGADLAAGSAATAFYEIVPASHDARASIGKDLFTVSVRYQDPQDRSAQKLDLAATDAGQGFDRANEDFRFAAAVAAFGMLLRDSQFKGNATYGDVIRWASAGKGPDETGDRAAFVELARRARDLSR